MDKDIEKVINRIERMEGLLREEIAHLREDLRVIDKDVMEVYELIAWNKRDYFFKEWIDKIKGDVDAIKRKVGI